MIVNSFMIITLPLTMLLALCTGIIDGYTRFKTFNTPMLLQKILLSAIITALTIYPAYLVINEGITQENTFIIILLILGSLACAVILELLGKNY